ncbi:MAG: hypothetical protein ACFFDR_05835 [Candidatus Thorarchaeota archaeon]
MTTEKGFVMTALAIFILVLGVPFAAAQSNGLQYHESAGIVTLSTEDIDIRITGVSEVPHFHWWDPNTPTVDYHVMFVSIFEANDTNSDGVFENGVDHIIGARFALPTTDWEFSGFDEETDGENVTAIHFNFTSTETFDPRPTGGGDFGNIPNLPEFDVTIQLRVHLNLDNPGEFKFDVIIEGWEWTYEDSILVMQYTVTQSTHGQTQGNDDPEGFHRTGTKFEFANGYMQYNETALAAQNTLEVKASYGEGVGQEAGESIYLAFENFGNETLEYDPIIGISSTDSLLLDANTLLIIGGVVVVVVVLALVFKMKK